MIWAKWQDTNLCIGDTVRVYNTVVEGTKQRTQVFEGIVIAFSGRGQDKMLTVRRIGAGGVGVERKWPLNARSIIKIEMKKHAKKIRRSKLYFLRKLTGRQAIRI